MLQDLHSNLIVLRDAVAMELERKPHLESLPESLRTLRYLIVGLLRANGITSETCKELFLADIQVQFIPSPQYQSHAHLFGCAGLQHAYGVLPGTERTKLLSACIALRNDAAHMAKSAPHTPERSLALQRLLVFCGHLCELLQRSLVESWEALPHSERPAYPRWRTEADTKPTHHHIFARREKRPISDILKRPQPVTI